MDGLARKVAVAAIAQLQDAQRLAITQLKTSALPPKGVLYRMFSPPPLTWYQRRPHSNTTPGAYEWQTLSAERTSSTKLCPRQPLMACPFLKGESQQSIHGSQRRRFGAKWTSQLKEKHGDPHEEDVCHSAKNSGSQQEEKGLKDAFQQKWLIKTF